MNLSKLKAFTESVDKICDLRETVGQRYEREKREHIEADRDALWRRAIETVFNVVFSGYAQSTRRQWSDDIAREVARLSAATGGSE